MLTDLTESVKSYEPNEIEGINAKEESTMTINNDTSVVETNDKTITHEIIFKVENTKLPYDFYTVKESCPALNEYISKLKGPYGVITINLPKWITKNELLEYFFFYKSGIALNIKDGYFNSILRLADFFENSELIEKIIQNNILPLLNDHSALIYLAEAYENFSGENNNGSYCNAKIQWFDLFIACKEYISNNLMNYITKGELRKKILYIKEKVLDEIIEEYIREKSESIKEDKEKELFNFICEYKKCECIYDVINNSRYYYNANEANATLSSILDSFPSFQFYCNNISIEENNILEMPILRYSNEFDFVFSVTYNKAKDMLYIDARLKSKKKLQIHSFSFFYFYNNNDKKVTQIEKTFIPNISNLTNILEISNLSKKLNQKISIYIKIHTTYSFILSYFIKNISSFFQSQKNKLLSVDLIKTMLYSHSYYNINQSYIVSILVEWLESNPRNESILSEIINEIDWGKINRVLLYKFIVKFASLISISENEGKFIKEVSPIIDIDIYNASKEVNYIQVINEKNALERSINKSEVNNINSLKDISSIRKTKSNSMNLFEDTQDKNQMKDLLELEHTIDFELPQRKFTNIITQPPEMQMIKRKNKSQYISQHTSQSKSKSPCLLTTSSVNSKAIKKNKSFLSSTSIGRISCKTSVSTVTSNKDKQSSLRKQNLFMQYSHKMNNRNNISNNSSNYFTSK